MRRKNTIPFPCEALSELILKRGYSISDTKLSEMTGIARTTLHFLCTNPKANPRWSTLRDLLEALDYKITISQKPWPKKKEAS